MIQKLLSIVFVLFLSISAFADSQPTAREWQVDGVPREALVYVPASAKKDSVNAKTSPCPIVFAFHGHGGTMRSSARSFNYHSIWPEALVVYMQGLKTPGKLTDPEGKRTGWQHGLGAENDRDLKFFDAVLASLKADYYVDESRIYSTGHSNGGGFTYLLWGNRGDIFAAMAPSSAVPGKDWRDLKPKPALHLAGKNDPLVKYTWQELAIAGVKKLNGCDGDGTPWMESGKLVGMLYASPSGTPFITLIHPGGHEFPSEAPAMIVKFFKEHAKAKTANSIEQETTR